MLFGDPGGLEYVRHGAQIAPPVLNRVDAILSAGHIEVADLRPMWPFVPGIERVVFIRTAKHNAVSARIRVLEAERGDLILIDHYRLFGSSLTDAAVRLSALAEATGAAIVGYGATLAPADRLPAGCRTLIYAIEPCLHGFSEQHLRDFDGHLASTRDDVPGRYAA
ncbi:MAG: hypothetical protein KDJ29_00745 [Hyphomicrobiales bacterium]|nr:hypothetical protein [Hyphomicrobiales bacterium]